MRILQSFVISGSADVFWLSAWLCIMWTNFWHNHLWNKTHEFAQSWWRLCLCNAAKNKMVIQITRDVMKLGFEFDNVRTSNVFSRFEVRQNFSHSCRRIRTSGLHDRHHMSTPTGHRNNQLNKCALPNSLKGPKIILDMADSHVSKDGPFRVLSNALTYLLSDFFGITSLHFLS